MTCVQTTATYSHLLGSCVTMLLSACAYIITHTVSSGDAKREQGGVPPARESQTRAEREEKPAVVEQTRIEEENSREEEEVSLTSEPQPNRTGICPAGAAAAGGVEREIEVEQNEQEGEVEGGGGGKLAPAESAISNGAAVLRNGDVTKSSMSDSTAVIKVKVRCMYV